MPFVASMRKNYGTFAFEAGYLQSLVISMLPMLPKKAQKILIEDMVRAAKKQEAEAAKKIDENKTMERAL